MGFLHKNDKIFVAGHRGLVGSALVEALRNKGYSNILVKKRSELNLTDSQSTLNFLQSEKPDVVFLAAAKVGGILANNIYRADFIYENLQIQNSVIWNSRIAGVKRLVFLGSSCIYPKMAFQPIKESELLTGSLEITNRPYALAKIAGLEMVDSLRKQFSCDYFSVMPTNLFGPGDNFDLENSHVLPALVRKILEAQKTGKPEVEIWGTGTPLREFMHSTECADAILHLSEQCSFDFFEQLGHSHINVGTGDEISIKDLSVMIAEIIGYKGKLAFDNSKPDGTPRKLLDSEVLRNSGWQPRMTFFSALKKTIDWYKGTIS